MTRRGLFGLIGAAFAGAALDPEKLLWRPGRKLISIPARGPFRFNGMPVYVDARFPRDSIFFFSSEQYNEYRSLGNMITACDLEAGTCTITEVFQKLPPDRTFALVATALPAPAAD